ncbi:MAG: alpha/beta fold hydrolase [Trueperaceae bacterium]
MSKSNRGSVSRWLSVLGAVGVAAGAVFLARRDRRLGSMNVDLAERPGVELSIGSEVVAGIRMRWIEHGHGTPVVLLHGIPTSPALWRKVMPRLRQAHAFAWEMVGYGQSIREGQGRDISVARQADYLASWLRNMRLGKVVLAGHDLGGGVALIVAARYPEMVSGLLLVDSIAYDSWPIPVVKAVRAAGSGVENMPAAAVRLMLGLLLYRGHDDRRVARESAAIHLDHYRASDSSRALVHQVRSLDVNDTLAISERLPHLKVPARVVWGSADPYQKPKYGELLAHDLGTGVERIEGGRHFTPEDHPDEVAEVLNDLLREVESEAEHVLDRLS